MTVTPAPDVELDLAAIPDAVRGAGFTPADMRIVARGTFEPDGEGTRFRIRGWRTALPVRGAVPRASGELELHARVDTDGGIVLELEP